MKNQLNKTIKAILFDFDGTLVDSVVCFHYVLNRLLSAHQQPHISLEFIRSIAEKGSLAAIQRCFLLKKRDPAGERLQQQFFNLWLEQMTAKELFFDGVLAQLKQLKQHQLPWGIVSNRPQRFAEPHIAFHQLEQMTPCLIWGDTLPTRKPQPETLWLGCQTLQTSPEHTLYVGDTENDMGAALAAGLPFAFAQYGYLTEDSKQAEIQRDITLSTPTELMQLIDALRQRQPLML